MKIREELKKEKTIHIASWDNVKPHWQIMKYYSSSGSVYIEAIQRLNNRIIAKFLGIAN